MDTKHSKRKKWLFAVGTAFVALGWVAWSSLLSRAAVPFTANAPRVQWAAPVSGLKLHVFQTGRMVLDAWAVSVGASGKRVMDQPAYLIEHPQHGLLMFEAGHHSEIANDPGEHLGLIHELGLMPMEQERGQDARTQLARAGFDPDAVSFLVVSHFHPEHVGAVEEFPRATVIADAREIAWGTDNPDYNYVPHEYDAVRAWKPLSFEASDPFSAFPGALDLFGDGSVLIVSTPGHTPGHVSVAVNLASGPVLLTGDVAWTELNMESASIGLPFVSSDGDAARVSLGQLLRFREDHPSVLIVPGHDLAPIRRSRRADVSVHDWPAPKPTQPPRA